MAPKTLIIKKYENRRLYNTATSQYINLEQVAQFVRDGYDVRILDAATGEDLTRMVLAQIVVEDAKAPDSVFPLDILRQMIVVSGRATQESALHYMESMLNLYKNAFPKLPVPLNPLDLLRFTQPESAGATNREEQGATEAADATNSEQALKRRIAELEAMIPKRAKRKAAKPRGKSRRKS